MTIFNFIVFFMPNMRDLEQIRWSPGIPGIGFTGRCSEPPSTRAGGQDDGSYTNSLKLLT